MASLTAILPRRFSTPSFSWRRAWSMNAWSATSATTSVAHSDVEAAYHHVPRVPDTPATPIKLSPAPLRVRSRSSDGEPTPAGEHDREVRVFIDSPPRIPTPKHAGVNRWTVFGLVFATILLTILATLTVIAIKSSPPPPPPSVAPSVAPEAVTRALSLSNPLDVSMCAQLDEARVAVTSAAAAVELEKHLAQPFNCRLDSWIEGSWSTDGHTYSPRVLRRPDGQVTALRADESYKIYSTEETRQCLRSNRLYFLGPSYMRDVFTTLVDLLHGYHRVGYRQMNPPEKNITMLGTGFEEIHFLNANGFFRDFAKIEANMARFAGATLFADNLVWDVNQPTIDLMGGDVAMTEEVYFTNLRRFLVLCTKYEVRLVWMTQMSHEAATGLLTVPGKYQMTQTDERFVRLLKRTFLMLDEFSFPWLDVFTMAGTCVTDPAEKDPTHQPCNASGHSNWYVSQMKAQMALNYACRCNDALRPLPTRQPDATSSAIAAEQRPDAVSKPAAAH